MTLPRGYGLRLARQNDIVRLIDVESAAGLLFAAHGYPSIAAQPAATPQEYLSLLAAQHVVVAVDASDRAVGVARACAVGTAHWLAELSVDPEHGRRGLGAALLQAFLEEALRRGRTLAALSTFRTVPFNAPFYARRGFAAIDPASADEALHARFMAEMPPGVAPCDRVLMTREL